MYKKHQSYSTYKDQVSFLAQELQKPHHALGAVFGDSEVLIEFALHKIKQIFFKSHYEVTAIEAPQWVQSDILLGQNHLFDPQNLYLITRCETVRNWTPWLKQFLHFLSSKKEHKDKILLLFKSDKIPETLLKELKKISSPTASCFDPWPNEFPTLVKDLASRFDLMLSEDALDTLIEVNGYDLIKHKHDLGKLSLLFAQKSKKYVLKTADISVHLGMLRSEESIKLDRFLTEGEWDKAQSLVLNLVNEGEKALSILGILSFHCRHKIQIEYSKQKGISADQMAKTTGMSFYTIKNAMPNPKKVTLASYHKALMSCKNADFLLKSTKIAPELLLFEIIDILATNT